MPSRLAAPVLTVDAGKMRKVDPRNVESLFGMWTGKSAKAMFASGPAVDSDRVSDLSASVFSKCAESIEGGKRLENMSWRLWNRETFCCEAQPQYSVTPVMDMPRRGPSPKDVPALSSSVESALSVEQPEREACSPQQDDSALSRSRGKEKHMTPLGLEKMVSSIKEQTELEPLSPSVTACLPPTSDETPRPSLPSPQIEPMHTERSAPLPTSSESCSSAATVDSSHHSDHRGSDTSVSSGGLIKSGSIVHGFSPPHPSSSFRARVAPVPMRSEPEAALSRPEPSSKKQKGGMFTLGGSSGEEESSFEERMSQHTKHSSLSDRLKQSHVNPNSNPGSFKAVLQSSRPIRTIKEGQDEDGGAIESDERWMRVPSRTRRKKRKRKRKTLTGKTHQLRACTLMWRSRRLSLNG